MGFLGGSTQNIVGTGRNYPGFAEDYFLRFFSDSMDASLNAFTIYELHYGKGGTDSVYPNQPKNETDGIAALAVRAYNPPPEVVSAKSLVLGNLQGKNILAQFDPVLLFNQVPIDLDADFAARAGEITRDMREISLPSMAQECNAIGRFGGSSHVYLRYRLAVEIARKLAALAKDVYYQTYKETRKIQHDSLPNAITYGREAITDAENLYKTGGVQREYAQGMYDAAYKAYHDVQQLAVKKLEILGNAVKMLKGIGFTSVDPYYRPSDWIGGAGLAIAGLSAAVGIYKNSKNGGGGGSATGENPIENASLLNPGSALTEYGFPDMNSAPKGFLGPYAGANSNE